MQSSTQGISTQPTVVTAKHMPTLPKVCHVAAQPFGSAMHLSGDTSSQTFVMLGKAARGQPSDIRMAANSSTTVFGGAFTVRPQRPNTGPFTAEPVMGDAEEHRYTGSSVG
mmetsp:Transcript_14296/g.28298  ORF Transcript_14296/g.28298 Transcript_14296/m.28298 type:complete len:111 (+) Transcript_14296:95-427(+)